MADRLENDRVDDSAILKRDFPNCTVALLFSESGDETAMDTVQTMLASALSATKHIIRKSTDS